MGKKRDYNRRFQEMCTHHLVEPVACTPGAGWEKGQVERQVGDVRGRLFVPSPRGRSYAEINEWLMDRCIEDARKHPHPTIPGKTVWQVFEEGRPFLTAYRGPFDGFHATEVAVSKTCLVRCAMARPSRAGSCPTRSGACGPGFPPATTATGSSSRFSRRCWRTGWRRSKRPVPGRSTAAPAAPTSCSTSWPGSASRRRQRASRRPRACGFATSRWPIVSATTA